MLLYFSFAFLLETFPLQDLPIDEACYPIGPLSFVISPFEGLELDTTNTQAKKKEGSSSYQYINTSRIIRLIDSDIHGRMDVFKVTFI